MKKRINISIEYETLEEAKKNIKNISKYLETCLVRFNNKVKEVKKEMPEAKNTTNKNEEPTDEEVEQLIKELDALETK
jgi:Post-segregation antitoxin CcdA.